ncbi:MAG: hypothetical protein ACI89W_001384 [Gammaproteobacteria bacterium]|jgi:hypothetical protein
MKIYYLIIPVGSKDKTSHFIDVSKRKGWAVKDKDKLFIFSVTIYL